MEYVNQIAALIGSANGAPDCVVNQAVLLVVGQLTAPPLPWIPEGGARADDGSDPQIVLQTSDDGGRTWSAERSVSLGKIGAFKTLPTWRRLGRSNNRVFRVICSAPVQVALVAADLDTNA